MERVHECMEAEGVGGQVLPHEREAYGMGEMRRGETTSYEFNPFLNP